MKSGQKKGGARGAIPGIAKVITLPGVLTEMASLYRQVRTGKLKADEGRGLVWILAQIRDTIEVSFIETRIAQLEEESRLNEINRYGGGRAGARRS